MDVLQSSLSNKTIKNSVSPNPSHCPKCRTIISLNSSECPLCGVVLAKAQLTFLEGEIEFRGSQELAQAWEQVREDYNDQRRHHVFVQKCFQQNKLTYASHKYRMILDASPSESMALMMRGQILALAQSRVEMSRPSPLVTLQKKLTAFHLIYFLAGMVIVTGFILPNMRNLVGLGAAMMFVTLGLRFTVLSGSAD